jgi:DNA-binding CsgD family transcriptional regulator
VHVSGGMPVHDATFRHAAGAGRDRARPPFTGRRDALASVGDLLSPAARSRTRIVEVAGDPGIGKTRLLGELRDLAARQGVPVLWSRATEAGRGVPYGVLLDLLGSDAEPTHATVRDRLLTAAGAVVIVDDLHWADPASVEVLSAVLRKAVLRQPVPVLLAVAYRPRQLAARLTVPATATRLVVDLPPLSRDEAEVLLRPLPGPARDPVYDASGGNPGHLTALVDGGGPDPSTWDRSRAATVLRALSGEFAPLDPPAVLAARAAAVLGTPFDGPLLAAVAGIAPDRIAGPLDELCARDLIRDDGNGHDGNGHDGNGYAFRHPVVAAAAYATAPAGWRLEAHARADRVLASRAAPASVRVRHVARVAQAGDDDAVRVLVEAADSAGRTDPGEAARLLSIAVRLVPHAAGPRRVDLMLAQAEALAAAGRPDRGREVLHDVLRAVPAGPDGRRLAAARRCAAAESALGHHDEARALLIAELARPDDAGGSAIGAAAELASGYAHRFGASDGASNGAADEAWRWAARVLALADRFPARATDLVRARCALAVAALTVDHTADHDTTDHDAAGPRRADSLYRRAIAGLADLPDTELAGDLFAAVDAGWAGLAFERYPDALRNAERGLAVARATGRLGGVAELHLVAATAATRLDRFAEATAGTVELAGYAERLGRGDLATEVAALRAEIALRRGDIEEGRRYAQLAVAGGRAGAPWWTATGEAALGWALLAAGDGAGCVRELLDLGGPELAAFPLAARLRSGQMLAKAHLAAGDHYKFRRWAARTAATAARLGRPDPLGRPEPAAARQADPPAAAELTDREREIATLASLGHTNRDIAERLFLSRRTVENHMAHALSKLGIRSRAALAGRLAHAASKAAR